MLLIPAIDLKNGHCVRLRQGRMDDATVFSKDPADVAKRFIDEGGERLHVVDLDGAVKGAPVNLRVIEKIVAAVADKFICIADESKLVPYLGKFPLPVEVIPMARGYVARELMKLSAEHPFVEVNLRQLADGKPFVTDNGNVILDVTGLKITDPKALEAAIDAITGVVTVGLFAKRGADVCLLGTASGVRTLGA